MGKMGHAGFLITYTQCISCKLYDEGAPGSICCAMEAMLVQHQLASSKGNTVPSSFTRQLRKNLHMATAFSISFHTERQK